jgi:putative membrane protein
MKMMWGYYDGWSWLWMAAMMVLFWGGIFAVVLFAVRALAGPHGNDQATDVLRRRLASGDITQEEFEKTRKALQR